MWLDSSLLAFGRCLLTGVLIAAPVAAEPPFFGTIFLDPDIITDQDPTAFASLADKGTGTRTMYDRRLNAWVVLEPYLFEAAYDDGLVIEFQVNPEFGSVEAARAEAERYAPVIGRLPTGLRRDVETSWIHKGVNPFGGGNRNLLIHIGQAALYEADGILEETLVHEASHTSLDADHATAEGWLEAQAADEDFISTYARDHPTREDIAESYLLYFAWRHRRDRISDALATTIEATIPNRLAYFMANEIELYPLVAPGIVPLESFELDAESGQWRLTWRSQPNASYTIERSTNLVDWEVVAIDLLSGGLTTTHLLDPSGERAFYRVHERTPFP